MSDLKVVVGGSLAEDAAAFVSAWGKSERGEQVADTSPAPSSTTTSS